MCIRDRSPHSCLFRLSAAPSQSQPDRETPPSQPEPEPEPEPLPPRGIGSSILEYSAAPLPGRALPAAQHVPGPHHVPCGGALHAHLPFHHTAHPLHTPHSASLAATMSDQRARRLRVPVEPSLRVCRAPGRQRRGSSLRDTRSQRSGAARAGSRRGADGRSLVSPLEARSSRRGWRGSSASRAGSRGRRRGRGRGGRA
eukprot:1786076-Rhodomonas_salina.1